MRMALVWGLAVLALVSTAGAQAVCDEGILASGPMDAYAGSGACAPCHEREYGPWSVSIMATFVAFARDLERIPGKWKKAPFDRDDVFLVVGKRRKVAFVDRSWTVIPHEYRLAKGKWKENWTGGHDYRSRCGPCHLTGSNPGTGEFKELGVGCEACHGPGAGHVSSQAAADIIVPGRTDGAPVLDTCRRCHNQRNRHFEAIAGFVGPFHR